MTTERDERPETTHALFDHERVADGYATARPYLHPEVFARVARLVGGNGPAARALDVGCGTGLSSVALLALARRVVGIDGSVAMVRRARRADGARYAASVAETLPFANGSFDLVVACGSIDWVDRGRFLPEAARVLRRGGALVPLDFGDRGASDDVAGLEEWHRREFVGRFPVPPSQDPFVTAAEAEAHGFTAPEREDFDAEWRFTAREYASFLMTESSIVAVVEYGARRAEEIDAWLESELRALFGAERRSVRFGGYVQVLRKL
ncbi:MAG: methyltransferase domain-containing protein [Vicinamibacteria bacterium]